MASNRRHRPRIAQRNTEEGNGPQSKEELLKSEELIRSMSGCLLRMAVAMKLPADLTEDVRQQAWLALLEHLHRHGKDSVRKVCSWMRQVMRNEIKDAQRRLHPGIVSLDALLAEPMAPEGDEIARKRRAWLKERLEEMAEDESQNGRLLRRRFVEGRTNAELAAAESLTEKAVELRICRRIKGLRQKAMEDGLMAPIQEGSSPGKKLEKK